MIRLTPNTTTDTDTMISDIFWKRHPRKVPQGWQNKMTTTRSDTNSRRTLANTSSHGISLSYLNDHDCLLRILEFLSWQDLNVFALVSRDCQKARAHSSLDQTRSGIIALARTNTTAKRTGRVTNAIELMDIVREKQWSQVFSGNRKHLRLIGLMHLSSYIEPINEDYIENKIAPLTEVTSLDCSSPETCRQRPWLLPYGDYIDKGFAHGLAISLLFPNLKQIDMSYLPLTLLGVDWLLQNNPNLESIRWNRSVIWPINSDTCDHIKSCRNVKEIYLEDAKMIICDHDWDYQAEELWTCLGENCQQLEKVNIRGAKYHYKKTAGLSPIPQHRLIQLVRCLPKLQWFCSDLSPENVDMLSQERPEIQFSR